MIATKQKAGDRAVSSAPAVKTTEVRSARPRTRRVFTIAVALLALAGAAGYWFLVGPGVGDRSPTTATPQPEAGLGVVQIIEPISLNLAEGRYLRIGLGLQLTDDVDEEEVDPSRALDRTISLFSGRTVDEVSSTAGRAALKAALIDALLDDYEGDVVDVFFVEFVTQ